LQIGSINPPDPTKNPLIDIAARCQLQLRYCTILKNRQDACSTKSRFFLVERAGEPVQKTIRLG
ncbi:hypothetical protein QUA00_29050, partial [Microcoleus sp. T2B6]